MTNADYPSDVSGDDPFGAAERIQRAAARQATRETWKWWFYGALALVPLAIGLLVLNSGRLDRDQIRKDVVAEVRPIESNVREALRTVDEAKPALRQVKQLEALAAEIKDVGTLTEKVNGTASAIEEYGQRIGELQARVASTEAREQQLAALSQDFAAFRTEQMAAARRVEERQQQIQTDLGRLRDQVGKQQFTDPRVPGLMERLQRMEKQVTPLLREKANPRSGVIR